MLLDVFESTGLRQDKRLLRLDTEGSYGENHGTDFDLSHVDQRLRHGADFRIFIDLRPPLAPGKPMVWPACTPLVAARGSLWHPSDAAGDRVYLSAGHGFCASAQFRLRGADQWLE